MATDCLTAVVAYSEFFVCACCYYAAIKVQNIYEIRYRLQYNTHNHINLSEELTHLPAFRFIAIRAQIAGLLSAIFYSRRRDCPIVWDSV